MYNTVANPDLQIGGGGGGVHPDPEIRGGPVLKKFFFFGPSGLSLVQKKGGGAFPGSTTARGTVILGT